MCGNMVDIQSVAAEIRRGKKKKKKEEETGRKYNVRICYAGRPLSEAEPVADHSECLKGGLGV